MKADVITLIAVTAGAVPVSPQPTLEVTGSHFLSMLKASWFSLPEGVFWLMRDAWPNVGPAGLLPED